ncbi:MAG: transposase, partial [Methylocella sp.]
MKRDTTEQAAEATEEKLFDNWFDPVETILRSKVRGFLETMIEEELEAALGRPRYGRRLESDPEDETVKPLIGHRHGRRTRTLTGTFGQTEITMPRARTDCEDGKTGEWKSKVLRSYQRRTATIDALIASAYLSGTNTRRVKGALAALFAEGAGKDVVSRVWHKVKGDWDT